MMQEQQKEYNGTSYTLVSFTTGDDLKGLKKTADDFITYSNSVKKRIDRKFKTFQSTNDELESTVRSYGRNRLTLRGGYDETINWKGGFFIVAETENGEQALSLLEHGLNQDRPDFPVTVVTPTEVAIHRTIPTTYQPLNKIPIELKQAVSYDGKRCISIAAERRHPMLMWREVYHGFIEELNSVGIEEIPQDNSLIRRVVKLFNH